MNVNLARRNGFRPVGQAQDRRVTEARGLPTVDEWYNIGPLVELLDTAFDAVGLEVSLVDVSPNGTAERIREIIAAAAGECAARSGLGGPHPPPASKGLGQHPRAHWIGTVGFHAAGSRHMTGGGIGRWDAAVRK